MKLLLHNWSESKPMPYHLGKLSGRHAFTNKLEELGYHFDETERNLLFKKFKVLADKKKQVTDQDIQALIADKQTREADLYQLSAIQLQYVSNGYQAAVVSITTPEQEIKTASAIGDGSIQAIYNAIDDVFEQKPILTNYEIQALTSGKMPKRRYVSHSRIHRQLNKLWNRRGF